MRFAFLTVIIALTTFITFVSACVPREAPCSQNTDCCDKKDKCTPIVSGSSFLCTLDDSPFGPRNISRMVLKCAIIMEISPTEAVKFARRNTLVNYVSAFSLVLLLME